MMGQTGEQTEAHGKQHQHEKQESGQSGIREGGKAQGELLPGTGVQGKCAQRRVLRRVA